MTLNNAAIATVGAEAGLGLPYRQLSRIVTENGANVSAYLMRLFQGDYTRGVGFMLLARLCVDDWQRNGALSVPDAISTYVTPHRLAASLSCSSETMRRHMTALADDAMVTRQPRLALDASGPQAERILAFYRFAHDLMLRTVAETAETTDMSIAVGAHVSVTQVDIVKACLDQALVPFSNDRLYTKDWAVVGMWGIINVLNIRNVTYDPILATRYAVTSSPDMLREPVSLREIAVAFGMPYATAWRCIRRMEAERMVTQVDKGWVVLTSNLRIDSIEEALIRNMTYFGRKLRELLARGLDPNVARLAYLDKEPALVGSEIHPFGP